MRDHLCQPDGVPAFFSGDAAGGEELPSAGTPRALGDQAAGPTDPHNEMRRFANDVHRGVLLLPASQQRSLTCAQLAADMLVVGADPVALQNFTDAIGRVRPPSTRLTSETPWTSFWRGDQPDFSGTARPPRSTSTVQWRRSEQAEQLRTRLVVDYRTTRWPALEVLEAARRNDRHEERLSSQSDTHSSMPSLSGSPRTPPLDSEEDVAAEMICTRCGLPMSAHPCPPPCSFDSRASSPRLKGKDRPMKGKGKRSEKGKRDEKVKRDEKGKRDKKGKRGKGLRYHACAAVDDVLPAAERELI